MKINKENVRHVAELAKIKFSEDDLDRFTLQMEDIMNMASELGKINTEGIKSTINMSDNINVMRNDTPQRPIAREELMKNVPDHEKGFIKVPSIIKGKED